MDTLYKALTKKFSETHQIDIGEHYQDFKDLADYVNVQFSRKDPSPSYDEFQKEVLKQSWEYFEKKFVSKIDSSRALDFVDSYDTYRQSQTHALKGLYQNTGYGQERQDTKSLTFRIPIASVSDFSLDLIETFNIDKLYNVYLDNINVFNGPVKSTNDEGAGGYYYVLKINEINIQSGSTMSEANNGIVIPIDADLPDKTGILKSKKFNYVGTINPCKLTSISGSLQAYSPDQTTETTLGTNGVVIVDLLFVATDKMSWK
jgi:hypothetical protein